MARTETVVFRTVEDPSLPQRPERCPWPDANVFLGGRMYSLNRAEELGTAQACARVSAPLVAGVDVPFYAEFSFGEGERYRAEGAAHVVSDDVPSPNVVLAGCTLRLIDGPANVIGGVVSSTSVFNPTREPSIETGSIWTILAYLRDKAEAG